MSVYEQAKALVVSGATLEVVTPTGDVLPAWPVEYLHLTADRLVYMWAGDERYHEHEVEGVTAGEEGAIIVRARGDFVVTIEPIWNPAHAEQLRRVVGEVSHPPEGWVYAAV